MANFILSPVYCNYTQKLIQCKIPSLESGVRENNSIDPLIHVPFQSTSSVKTKELGALKDCIVAIYH